MTFSEPLDFFYLNVFQNQYENKTYSSKNMGHILNQSFMIFQWHFVLVSALCGLTMLIIVNYAYLQATNPKPNPNPYYNPIVSTCC